MWPNSVNKTTFAWNEIDLQERDRVALVQAAVEKIKLFFERSTDAVSE
jgi:hypothetical protein